MNKSILLVFVAFLFFNSCLNKETYSFYGPFFKNAYKTKDNRSLFVEGFKDTIYIENNIPQKSAYFAIIKGEFIHVLDSVVQWGHVWTTNDKDTIPFINPDDTTTFSRFYPQKDKLYDSTIIFKSYVPLYPETKFWVRSYIITSKNDTGYMPIVYVDRSLPPINEWFDNDKDGTPLSHREGMCIFTVNYKGETKIFLACGNNGNQVFGDIYEFKKDNQKWEFLVDIPNMKRTEAIGFAVVEKNQNNQDELILYIGTGVDAFGNMKSDFWRIPYNNTFAAQKMPFELSTSLRSCVAFTINNVPYFGLGRSGFNNQSVGFFFRYNWVKNAQGKYPFESINTNFPTNRENAVVFMIGDVAYIGLGYNTNGNVYYNDFYRFTPPDITNTGESFTKIPDFPGSPRAEAVAFVVDNIAYVGTGRNDNNYYSNFYRYNPYQNAWDLVNQVADFKTGPDMYGENKIKNAAAFGIVLKQNGTFKKMGFVSGGRFVDGAFSNQTWFYRPW